jgi:hypothetical protein
LQPPRTVAIPGRPGIPTGAAPPADRAVVLGREQVADLLQQGDVGGDALLLGGEEALLGLGVGHHDEEVDDGGDQQERDHGVHERTERLLVAEDVVGALRQQARQPRDEGAHHRGERGGHDERGRQLDEVAAEDEVLEPGHGSDASAKR